MQSQVKLVPGESITVAAGATIAVSSVGTHALGDGPAVGVVELLIEGEGAAVTRRESPKSDDHAVEVVAGD